MAICPRCNTESDGSKPFCTNCGAPLTEHNSASEPASPPFEPRSLDERPPKGTRFAPMSIGAYIGTFLLLCLPVANLILLIVWACGGCLNENRRNLARALLILYGICVLLSILLILLLGGFQQVTEIISEAEVMANGSCIKWI